MSHLLCLIVRSQWKHDVFCARILCIRFLRKARNLSCGPVSRDKQILVMETEADKAPYVAYLPLIFWCSFCIPNSLSLSVFLSWISLNPVTTSSRMNTFKAWLKVDKHCFPWTDRMPCLPHMYNLCKSKSSCAKNDKVPPRSAAELIQPLQLNDQTLDFSRHAH